MTADTKSNKDRLGYLLALAGKMLDAKTSDGGTIPKARVDREAFAEFRAGTLALLTKTFGPGHPFYLEFDRQVSSAFASDVEKGRGILKAVMTELESQI